MDQANSLWDWNIQAYSACMYFYMCVCVKNKINNNNNNNSSNKNNDYNAVLDKIKLKIEGNNQLFIP
jgi:hypothetical protein